MHYGLFVLSAKETAALVQAMQSVHFIPDALRASINVKLYAPLLTFHDHPMDTKREHRNLRRAVVRKTHKVYRSLGIKKTPKP